MKTNPHVQCLRFSSPTPNSHRLCPSLFWSWRDASATPRLFVDRLLQNMDFALFWLVPHPVPDGNGWLGFPFTHKFVSLLDLKTESPVLVWFSEETPSVVQWHPFPHFFGGCPAKNGLPQKGFSLSLPTLNDQKDFGRTPCSRASCAHRRGWAWR